jgi:hypothetical protein
MPARFWRFFYLDPDSPLPLANCLFITLLGLQGRPLKAPSHLAQNSPHMSGMVVHLGHCLDELRHPWQRPQIGCVALCPCPLKQVRPDLLYLLMGQPPSSAGLRSPLDGGGVPTEPVVVPTADALTAYSQGHSNSSLWLSFAEQSDCLFSSLSEPLKPSGSPLHTKNIQRRLILVTILYEIQ